MHLRRFFRSLVPLCFLFFLFSPFDVSALQIQDSSPHSIQVLFQPGPAMFRRLKMIESARRSIVLETFIWQPDFVGRLFGSILAEKARKGVRVRILLDAAPIMLGLHANHYAALRHAGIEFKLYNPGFNFRLGAKKRDHRKLLIVDGEEDDGEVITGGRNIEEAYFSMGPVYNFLDRDVWVKGPIVSRVLETFETVWNSKFSKAPPQDKPRKGFPTLDEIDLDPSLLLPAKGDPKKLAEWKEAMLITRDPRKLLVPSSDPGLVKALSGEESPWDSDARVAVTLLEKIPVFKGPVEFVTSMPEDHGKLSPVWKRLEEVFLSADRTLLVETPYFVMRKEGMRFLKKLQEKQIDFELFTNSLASTDWPFPIFGYAMQAKKLDRLGVNVKLFKGTNATIEEALQEKKSGDIPRLVGLHGKSFVAGSSTSGVGTFNLDPQSIYFSLENYFIFENQPEIAGYLTSQLRPLDKLSFPRFFTDPTTQKRVKTKSPWDQILLPGDARFPIWLQKILSWFTKGYL